MIAFCRRCKRYVKDNIKGVPNIKVLACSIIEDYQDMHNMIEDFGRARFLAILRKQDEEFGYSEILDSLDD